MNKNKNYMYLSILVPLVGLKLSRSIVTKYGEGSRSIIMTIVLLALMVILITLTLKRRYFDVVLGCVLSVPLLIGAMGLYLDNLMLLGSGILLLFIAMIILLLVKKKYLKDRF